MKYLYKFYSFKGVLPSPNFLIYHVEGVGLNKIWHMINDSDDKINSANILGQNIIIGVRFKT